MPRIKESLVPETSNHDVDSAGDEWKAGACSCQDCLRLRAGMLLLLIRNSWLTRRLSFGCGAIPGLSAGNICTTQLAIKSGWSQIDISTICYVVDIHRSASLEFRS